MRINAAIAAAILAFCATNVLAAPVPQLAGEGAAANSLLSDTDNGIGYGTENALDNTAALVTSVKGGAPARRQLAGEGAAADSLLSDTDNGIGYGTENALDNTAALVSSTKGAAPARRQLAGEGAAADSLLSDTDNGIGYGTENALDNTASLISSTKPAKRQLDKISAGAQTLSNAAGTGAVTQNPTDSLSSIDGTLTSGAANTGNDVGTTEEGTLEAAGSAVPSSAKARRQLDKISAGVQTLSNAAGTGAVTQNPTDSLSSIDGTLTSGAANTGNDVGTTEEGTLEAAGSAVPSSAKTRRQLDKISNGVQTLSNAAGTGAETTTATGTGDSLDGTLTGDAADAGAEVGGDEASTLEGAGAAVPKI